MSFLKETWTLIKAFFTSPKGKTALEPVKMKYYPFSGYSAMSWCGLLISHSDSPDKETRTHESIHLLQAKIHHSTWFGYYVSYLWTWLIGTVYMFSSDFGYYTGKYESEAYAKEQDESYLDGYTAESIKKYAFSLSERKKLWKQVGGNRRAWKEYVKGL